MQWKLIKIRMEKNESQEQLARLIGKGSDTYRNKEKGRSQFSGDEMFIIANHYNVSIEDIFLPSEYTNRELSESK